MASARTFFALESYDAGLKEIGFAPAGFTGGGPGRDAAQLALFGATYRVHVAVFGEDHEVIAAGGNVHRFDARDDLDGEALVALQREAHVAVRIPKRSPSVHPSIVQQARGM